MGLATEAEGDEPEDWREFLYYHYYEGATREHRVPQHYGIYNGRYKLISHYENDEWEFFDLEADPYELNNLFYDADTGLPVLRDIDGDGTPDWEYRTFRLSDPISANPHGFLRAGVFEEDN